MSPTARTITPIVLFAFIVLSCVGAIVLGFVQLLWLGQATGANAATAAFVCLSVFAGASLVLLIFHLRELKAPGL